MLKRQFILQDTCSEKYASKDEEGSIYLWSESISSAHLFDTKTEIYDFIKSTNKKLDEVGQVIYFKIDEVIF